MRQQQSFAASGSSSSALALEVSDWRRIRADLRLSGRETEVVRHLLAGLSLKTVAAEMGLGLGTVKTYAQRIHRKLAVHDRLGLAMTVVRTHLARA